MKNGRNIYRDFQADKAYKCNRSRSDRTRGCKSTYGRNYAFICAATTCLTASMVVLKNEENELLSRYVALAPREEFADILDAIDRFVYFESRKV